MEYRKISDSCSRLRVETRDDGSPDAFIGYAAVFYRKDVAGTEYQFGWNETVRERIAPGAFDRALEEDDVRALANHNDDILLGRTSAGTLELSVDDTGLRYRIGYDPSDPDHQRVAAKIARGDLNGSSFAFSVREEDWGGSDEDGHIRELRDVQLYDVGPVTFPAYEATDASLRAVGDDTEARKAFDAYLSLRSQDGPLFNEEALRPWILRAQSLTTQARK